MAPQTFRPDVQVRQPWAHEQGGGVAVASRVVSPTATQPVRLFVDDEIERWIEIHDATERRVTVVELLSPANKQDELARSRYRNKRHTFHEQRRERSESGSGPARRRRLPRRGTNGHAYASCDLRRLHFSRDSSKGAGDLSDWLARSLAHALHPLRPTDPDVVLDLQPLIDQCHERGRYHRLNYRTDLLPPFSEADAAWVDTFLREHGLR